MSMMENRKSEFRFTGWHMLAIMIAFYAVIIAVNLFMAFSASSTWTGLIVKNTYVASQKYNGTLADARRQAQTGIRSEISYADGVLTTRLTDRDGEAVFPTDLTLSVGRPAFEQMDRMLTATCNSKGHCTARADLQPGHWLLRLEATVADDRYRRDARLRLSASGRVAVE